MHQVILQINSFIEQPVSSAVKLPQENIIQKAALLIRQSVTALTENSADVSWSPTYEQLDHE